MASNLDLINDKDFKETIQRIVSVCKKNKNSVMFTMLDQTGAESFSVSDANGEDVAFMAADQIFGYAKQLSEQSGIPVIELVTPLYKELTTYINALIDRDQKQMDLLRNPIGEA